MDTNTKHEAQEFVDLTGRTLGDYVLLRRLGRGGMADVYLAEQTSLNRQVAFKTLHPHLAKDRNYVQRFHREAKAAAALNQANIVQIYEVGENDRIHYIVQEYIRGQNLKQYMQRHSVVEPILAVNVVRNVCAALQKASEHGVIHRDIKPENIMITPAGEVKVTDFGLARVAKEVSTELTQVGITMGTPLYMSPEQVEGKPVDPRSDIYSLGVTTFQMLVGRPPFEGETPLALAIQHVKKLPPPIAKLRPDLPVEFCSLVEKMMAKKPENRFQDPSEILRALRKIKVDPDNDWASLAETLQLDSGVTQIDSDAHLAVTKQLENAMLGHLPKWWQSGKLYLAIAGLMFAGISVGTLIAFGNPPDPILPESSSIITESEIPKQDSVVNQYRWAYIKASPRRDGTNQVDPELAWQSVRKYFDPNKASTHADMINRSLWCRKADERLGELYIRNAEWDKAQEIYFSLTIIENVEEHFQIVGYAGLAVVFYHKGQFVDFEDMWYRIEPNLDELNSFLRFEIESINHEYY